MSAKRSVHVLAGVILLALSTASAVADGELCSFTVAGELANIACWDSPESIPGGCRLLVEVPMGQGTTRIQIFCLDEMAEVCELLRPGDFIVVLGEDNGESKEATHIGLWLKPEPTQAD